jgi:predicted nucleotidyltransferase
MRLLLDNLPSSLKGQRETIERCLRAMTEAMPLREVYLFGSHARGDARPDSDVDLCVVSDEAEQQFEGVACHGRRTPITRPIGFTCRKAV